MRLFRKKHRLDIRNTQALVLGILQIRLQAVSGAKQIFFTQVSMVEEDEQHSNYLHRTVTVDAFFADLATIAKPNKTPVIAATLILTRDDGETNWLPVSMRCVVRNFPQITRPFTECLTLGEGYNSIYRFRAWFTKVASIKS